MIKDSIFTLTILFMVGIGFSFTLDRLIFPVPHKEQTSATAAFLQGAGTTSVGPVAEVPVPGTGRAPYVAELQTEIAAREAQLDQLTAQLDQANAYIQEMANTLNGAIAERNEAIAMLEQMGALNRRPQL
jgi:hypothetical protein